MKGKKWIFSILYVALFAVFCSLGFSQNSFALTFGLNYGQSYGKLGTATVLRPWTDFGDNIIQSFSPSDNKYILTGLLLYPSIPAKTAVGFAINNIDISWRQYNNGNASYFNGVNPCNYVSAGGITGMNYQISNCTYSAAIGGTGGIDYYHVSFNLVAYATTSINIPANALYISIGNRASGFWENNILNTNTVYYNSFDYSSLEYYTSATDGLLQQQINQNQTIINQNQQIINQDNLDREKIEGESENAENSAAESSDELDEGTTTLIGALSSFLTTMSNLSAGNCTIPEIEAYGVSLGELNLCRYKPPTWIQGALSVIVSLIAIRLAYSIFKRIISIVKSFTGGNG